MQNKKNPSSKLHNQPGHCQLKNPDQQIFDPGFLEDENRVRTRKIRPLGARQNPHKSVGLAKDQAGAKTIFLAMVDLTSGILTASKPQLMENSGKVKAIALPGSGKSS